MTTSRKILLADDHVIIRRGLKVLLENHFFYMQLLEADTTSGILNILESNEVSFMILDMQLQDGNVLEIMPLLNSRYPHIPILIYTMSSEDVYGGRMFQLGAKGFLSKQCSEEEVIKALQLFFDGRTYISTQLQDVLADRKQANSNPLQSLSERELSVMSRLLKGETVKEISNQLNVKATTVATYKARIFEKLAVNNIMDLRNLIELYQYKSS